MSVDAALSTWLYNLVNTYQPRSSGLVSNPYSLQSGNRLLNAPSLPTDNKPITLEPRGTHTYAFADETINVGESGITFKISDLHIYHNGLQLMIDNQQLIVPDNTESANLEINGSDNDDAITIHQNSNGDTVLDVDHTGHTHTFNLGRIASLTLFGNNGDDAINIKVDDYYGGLNISGGAGNDTISVAASNAYREGVTIKGTSGHDHITLSESALSALVEAGADMTLMKLKSTPSNFYFTRKLMGGDSSDIIFGGTTRDMIDGGAGTDKLYGQQGDDLIYGGSDNDRINAGWDNDTIYGQTGDDTILAGRGDDFLYGANGADMLYGYMGNDTLKGGNGLDTFAPAARSPQEIYAYDKVGNHLKVMWRGEDRSQPVITNYNENNKILLDYDSDTDYLVDSNEVV